MEKGIKNGSHSAYPWLSRQTMARASARPPLTRRERITNSIHRRPWIGPGTACLGLMTFLASIMSISSGTGSAKADAAVPGDIKDNLVHASISTAHLLPKASTVPGTEIQPLRVYGQVEVELRPAMQALGVLDEQIDSYLKIISREVSPDTIGPGDHFDLVLQQKIGKNGQPELGKLIYAGLYRTDGINVRMAEWRRNGRMTWLNADEVGSAAQTIQRPVPGVVSSNFGYRRHPILGYTRMHKGLDFRAGQGTPILAVQTGYVDKAGWNSGGYGNRVELIHGSGISTTYSHMSRVAVRPGQYVQQGQVIGYVGSTGLSTGQHLHYELHRNGQAIDPASVQFNVTSQLAGADLIGYRKRLGLILSLPLGRSPERPWIS